MGKILHITSGDSSGDTLMKSKVSGEVLVWHDILYAGIRKPGWPDSTTIEARVRLIQDATGEGLAKESILTTLNGQYQKLENLEEYDRIVLWFDACLFDQSMLAHILACLHHQKIRKVELLCVDAFPGIRPFNGIGQLQPSQLESLYDQRDLVKESQFLFSLVPDEAFATQSIKMITQLSNSLDATLHCVPNAAKRWLQELPGPDTGLGRLERLALEAIYTG